MNIMRFRDMKKDHQPVFIAIILCCFLFVAFQKDSSHTLTSKPTKAENLTETHHTSIKKDQKRYFVLTVEDIQKKSFENLIGTWVSENSNDLVENITENPLSFIYEIKPDGKGTKTIIIDNELSCETDIEARFLQGGNLAVRDLFPARCTDGSVFSRSIMLCTLQEDGTTICEGEQGANREKYLLKLYYKE